MRKYVLDTNLYIGASRDRTVAAQLEAFYTAHLPATYLHATVAQELLAGTLRPAHRREVRAAWLRPFERRGRVLVPSYWAWSRSGELVASLIARGALSVGGVSRSFLNDALLAASCREAGATLVTANQVDFARLQLVEAFEFVPPWPGEGR